MDPKDLTPYDSELLMYQTMMELSRQKAPFVYKGGLITKYFLMENGEKDLTRFTQDIDANWLGEEPTMEYLCEKITEAARVIDPELKAVPYRQFDETKSAGIKIIRPDGEAQFKLDIDVHRPVAGTTYLFLNDVKITCVDEKQIIADKICSISSKTVFRRTKDLVDLFALSAFTSFTPEEILEISEKVNHEVQDFDCFLNRKDDLRHAYGTLKGVAVKPDFDLVYDHIKELIEPIIKAKDAQKDTIDYE